MFRNNADKSKWDSKNCSSFPQEGMIEKNREMEKKNKK